MEDKKNVLAIEGCKEANRKKNRYKDILPCKLMDLDLPLVFGAIMFFSLNIVFSL